MSPQTNRTASMDVIKEGFKSRNAKEIQLPLPKESKRIKHTIPLHSFPSGNHHIQFLFR